MAQILAHPFFKEPVSISDLEAVPARKHAFLSHFQKEGAGIAHTLYHALERFGAHAWLDMFEADLTERGMKRGKSTRGTTLPRRASRRRFLLDSRRGDTSSTRVEA